ncbi:MAG: hypothetical protein ACRDJN_17650, partial [Chloroflexota bacterium]
FSIEVRVRYRLLNLGGAAAQRTTPRPPLRAIRAMGYQAAFFAANCSRAAVKGLWDYLVSVRESGTAADLAFIESLRGYPFENWYEFTGYPALRAQEERYLPSGTMADRYTSTLGTYYVPPAPGAVPGVVPGAVDDRDDRVVTRNGVLEDRRGGNRA